MQTSFCKHPSGSFFVVIGVQGLGYWFRVKGTRRFILAVSDYKIAANPIPIVQATVSARNLGNKRCETLINPILSNQAPDTKHI